MRQFLLGTMAAPVCYSLLWLTIFGGAGLRMEREAAGANLCCHNLLLERLTTTSLAEVNLTKVGSLGELLCEDASCNSCSTRCSHKEVLKGSFRLLADVVTVDLDAWKAEVDLVQVDRASFCCIPLAASSIVHVGPE